MLIESNYIINQLILLVSSIKLSSIFKYTFPTFVLRLPRFSTDDKLLRFRKYMQKSLKFDCSLNSISLKSKGIQSSSLLCYRAVDKEVISFYQQLRPSVATNFIIPVSFLHQPQCSFIVYNRFGVPLCSVQDTEYAQIATVQTLLQLLTLHDELKDLIPEITLENIYYLPHNPVKLLILKRCIDKQEYICKFRSVLATVFKDSKLESQRIAKIKLSSDIFQWHAELLTQRQGRSVLRLMQLKPGPSNSEYRISLQQEQLQWIFTTLGYSNIPKYQLIYNGILNNFDSAPLLKVISKQLVLYVIENSKDQKIAFFSAAKADISTNTTFGNYYPDKSKKSLLLGLEKRSIHQLRQQDNSVGYGNEILLCIGKLDIIFSCFNAKNISYFPVSYTEDQEKHITTTANLLGPEFTLKQFQVYKL